MQARYYILFLFLFIDKFSFSQNVGLITPFVDTINVNEKVVLNGKQEAIVFGYYVDTRDSCSLSPIGLNQPIISNVKTKHHTLIRKPFSTYLHYIGGYSRCSGCNDKIVKLSDSTYLFQYLTVDTDQHYKSSTTRFVIFDGNANLLDTFKADLNSTACIEKTIVDQKNQCIYLLIIDTAFYSAFSRNLICKLDMKGKLLWQKYIKYGCASNFYNLIQLKSGNLVLGGNISTAKDASSICKWKYFMQEFKPDGTILFNRTTSDTIPDADASLIAFEQLNDNSFVAISLPVDQLYYNGSNYEGDYIISTYWSKIMVFDDSGQIKSSNRLFNNDYFNHTNYYEFYKLFPVQNSEMVLTGQYINQDFFHLPESKKQTGVAILKLDSSLHTKWLRHYVYKPNYYYQEIKDMTYNNDSLYIVGFTNENKTSNGKGWYIQTDKYGCVVEGCQLYDAVQEIGSAASLAQIMAYPSPAKLETRIRFNQPPENSQLDLLVMNLKGQLMSEFKNILPHAETILSTSSYPSGIYYLMLKSNGNLIASTKLVVE